MEEEKQGKNMVQNVVKGWKVRVMVVTNHYGKIHYEDDVRLKFVTS